MKKYKISKSNLKEFFGLFGKKKPQTLQSIIDADPVMRKLDNEMEDIAKTFIPRIRKANKTGAKSIQNRCKKIAKQLGIEL